MEVLLFSNFSKRKNSTLQVNDSTGVLRNLVLKGECSYVNPSFFISGTDNYTYLKAWGNYYFIDRRAYDINGAQYINCSIDVLATFKAQIMSMSAFVKYSSSNYNTNLIDTRIPTLVDEDTNSVVEYTELFTTDQCYVLTAVNKWGGLWHYILEEEDVQNILDKLSYDMGENPLTNVFAALQREFGSALSAIVSLVRLPVFKSKIATGSWFVGLGAYQVPSSEQPEEGETSWMTAPVSEDGWVREVIELTIPWQYTDFRKDRRYSTLTLTLPFIGQVELNNLDFVMSNKVYVRTDLCVWTGGITYTIYAENVNEAVATYKAQCGLEIPVSSVTLGNVKAMVGLGAGATALGALSAISNPSVGTVIGLNSAITAGTSLVHMFNQHQAVNMGSYSGTSAEYANKDYTLTVRYYPTVAEPDSLRILYGRPCMRVMSLANMSGYIETSGFSISLNEISEIKDLINSAMDNGVYLE